MIRTVFVRRVVEGIPMLLGILLITFVLFYGVGVNPVIAKLGKHASQNDIESLRHAMGLDQSYVHQFFVFLREALTFQFGESYLTHEPVRDLLLRGAAVSLSLALPAFLLSQLLGTLIALFWVSKSSFKLDRWLALTCSISMSVSLFAYILFAQYFLAFKWGWFPISGYEVEFFPRIQHLLLPWMIWIMGTLGGEVRYFYFIFSDQAKRDYIRTAVAKGLPPVQVLRKHLLPNTWVTLIARAALTLPFLFTGSLLLENFFSIPGLGKTAVEALSNADWPVVKAITWIGALLYFLFQLFADLLSAWVDPRVGYE